MKVSTLVLTSGSALVAASPYFKHHGQFYKHGSNFVHPDANDKRIVETETVISVVYKTVVVPAGQVATSSAPPAVVTETSTASDAPKETVAVQIRPQGSSGDDSGDSGSNNDNSGSDNSGSGSSGSGESSSDNSGTGGTRTSASNVNDGGSASGNNLPAPSDFISTVLYQHNAHRFNSSAQALIHNETLAAAARDLASTCKYKHDMSYRGGGYGQNIANWATTSESDAKGQSDELIIARSITDQWYNDEFNAWFVDNQFPGNTDGWDHLTQMLWKGTHQVGCAAVLCPLNTIYTNFYTWFSVCNYYPRGNIADVNNPKAAYDANVGQPLGQPVIVV